nr:hypothetical protein BaRGS_027085 [Batillaria attramentaria]
MASAYLGPESPRPLAVISESYRGQYRLPELGGEDRLSLGPEYEEQLFSLLHKYLELGTTDTLCYIGDTRDGLAARIEKRFCMMEPVRTLVPGHFHYAETGEHKMARLQWAQGHLNWNNVRWQNVLFSDESRFCIDHADGRVRVWRRRGDRYADNCVVENNAWGGPSLMLWGAIGHNQVLGPVIFQGLGPGRGKGITAQRYMDQVLHPHVLTYLLRPLAPRGA